ncbi:hypothetical protein FOL46_000423 [Perkinsus olseni]|uniref:Uncharacterized protein n=1 Tax=Perkinsus olseni TaxID=32597 RepID=A0A7J6MHV0_PEROL|nr:hypothetical protein FOL46_000423 [Perkinsus olseni]
MRLGISTPVAGDYRESRIPKACQLPPLRPRKVLSIRDGIPGYMGYVPGRTAENVFGRAIKGPITLEIPMGHSDDFLGVRRSDRASWTNTLDRSLSAHEIGEFGSINRPYPMGVYHGKGRLKPGYLFADDNTMVGRLAPLKVPLVESDGHREIPVHSSSYMHMRRGTSTCPFTGIHVDYAGRSPGQEGYGLQQPAIGMHIPRYTGFARGVYGENIYGLRNSRVGLVLISAFAFVVTIMDATCEKEAEGKGRWTEYYTPDVYHRADVANGQVVGGNSDLTASGLGSWDAPTTCPSTGLVTRSSVTEPARLTTSGMLFPPGSSSLFVEPYDPELAYSNLPEDERRHLEANSVVLSDGATLGIEEGWLVCLACEKKTHILRGAMLSHILSKKHKQNLSYYRWQEERKPSPSPSSEGQEQPKTVQWISVTESAELPEYIEETLLGYRCTLCEKNPQSLWCLETHINGQKHRSALEREAWRQQVLRDVSGGNALTPAPQEGVPATPATPSSLPPLPPPPPPIRQVRRYSGEEPLYAPNGRLLPPGFRTCLRKRAQVSK